MMGTIQILLMLVGLCSVTVSGIAEDIYFATGRTIQRWDLSRSTSYTVKSGLNRAVSLDFDISDRYLFWGDVYSRGIYRADLSSSGTATGQVRIAPATTPDGLVVDWVLNHVYWADKDEGKIMVCNYDGSGLKTLIETDIQYPRGIAIAQDEGYMFWTDWGINPKIERTSMDGNFRTVLVTTNLYWPNGLTIDHANKRIYWIDGSLKRIDSANFDGSDVRNVIAPGHSSLSHPFSLAILNTYIYFTNWGTLYSDSYFRRMKTSGLYNTNLYSSNSKIFDLKVYDTATQVTDVSAVATVTLCQQCSSNQLCLPRPHAVGCISITCACPDHVTCGVTYHTSCDSDLFYPPTAPVQPVGPSGSRDRDYYEIGNATEKDDDDDIESTVVIGLIVACILCGVLGTILVGVCIRQKVCKKNSGNHTQPLVVKPQQPPPYNVAVTNVPQHYPGLNQAYMNGQGPANIKNANFWKGAPPVSVIDI